MTHIKTDPTKTESNADELNTRSNCGPWYSLAPLSKDLPNPFSLSLDGSPYWMSVENKRNALCEPVEALIKDVFAKIQMRCVEEDHTPAQQATAVAFHSASIYHELNVQLDRSLVYPMKDALPVFISRLRTSAESNADATIKTVLRALASAIQDQYTAWLERNDEILAQPLLNEFLLCPDPHRPNRTPNHQFVEVEHPSTLAQFRCEDSFFASPLPHPEVFEED